MPLKAGATVRLVNIDTCVQRSDLHNLFASHNLEATSDLSLCADSVAQNGSQVATATFRSSSEAKKALTLHGTVLHKQNIAVDRDFMGITTLAAPKDPQLE